MSHPISDSEGRTDGRTDKFNNTQCDSTSCSYSYKANWKLEHGNCIATSATGTGTIASDVDSSDLALPSMQNRFHTIRLNNPDLFPKISRILGLWAPSKTNVQSRLGRRGQNMKYPRKQEAWADCKPHTPFAWSDFQLPTSSQLKIVRPILLDITEGSNRSAKHMKMPFTCVNHVDQRRAMWSLPLSCLMTSLFDSPTLFCGFVLHNKQDML